MTPPGPSDPRPERVFRLALVAWTLLVVASWWLAGPLGHDEAAYAIGGADLAGALPSPWLYRSVGMHLLALPGVLLGGGEHALRAPVLILAIVYLFAVRRVGRVLSPATGAWAAAVVVGAHGIAWRGHELLSDLPSTTGVLMGLAVLAEELLRADGPRWRIAAAAPWLAAGFYLRYASVVPIALVLASVALVAGRRLLAPGPPARLAGFVTLFALLLVPHLVQALQLTGSPLGIIRFSSGVPRQDYFGDGLVNYLFGNPFAMYGVLATPVLLAGLVSGFRALGAAARVFWLVAVGHVVILGLMSHGQPRYIYVALSLLVVLGVDLVRRVEAPAWRRAASAAVAVAALGSFVGAVVAARHSHGWLDPIAEAGAIIRRDAAGRSCHVVSRRFTQLMWYSGCGSADQGPHPAALARVSLVYGVWFDGVAGTAGPETFEVDPGVPLLAAPVAKQPGRFEILRLTRPPPGTGIPRARRR
jgi:hypothetical protein